MKPVIEILEEKISAAIEAVAGQRYPAIVRPTTDARFGDYQVNGVMAAAKQLKTNPRKLAEQILEKLDLSDICDQPEVAGPGFINLRLNSQFLEKSLLEIRNDTQHLGIEKTGQPKNIVVDFSGPNIAKQMHVGHLRSTIIGDCICRLLEFLGHKVIRQNHIGDWGTQFGMLICYLEEVIKPKIDRMSNELQMKQGGIVVSNFSIPNMEDFYRDAKSLYDTDSEFARKSRDYVVKLHKEDKDVIHDWEFIRLQSLSHCQEIYDLLAVNLSYKNVRGESDYREKLPLIVEELYGRSIAEKSNGAVCVFPEGFKNKEGQELPFIIQKSDGAFLYATTDLAALKYRVNELKADTIIYVTDSRQKLHFEMLFAVAKMAGWVSEKTELSHVMFGSVLGENGQPLKTRSGENVKLKELLDEAVERAKKVVENKNPELSSEEKEKIAKAVGIGAVKYADYSNNRTSDYVFSFDKMLAMEGNTAPYMQYAYARIKSIERKGGINTGDELVNLESLNLTQPEELNMAKHLLRYSEAIQSAVADYRPNYLTSYLYELAQKFSTFYTSCPVLKAEPATRQTRLLLCDLTAATIKHGLVELLGIEVLEQM